MIKRERFWRNGVLIRELADGVEIAENLGKNREQLGLPLSPTIARKTLNAAGAAVRVIKAKTSGQKTTVPDEERNRRLSICAGCEFFTGITCLKCGCVARWKAKLAAEKCPIGKW